MASLSSRRRNRRLKIAGLILAGVAALGAAGVVAGSALSPKSPPPVSEQVQKYYDENVANKKATLPTAGPTVAFIGDSYTFGTGAQNRLNRWSTQVTVAQGWSEQNFGKGGTGYVSVSQQCNGPCSNYAGSIKDAAAAKPSIVIVAGIRNDASLAPAVLDPAIPAFYAALRTALPDAKIIAISPIWDAATPPARVNTIGQNIKAAVESVNGSYLDIGQPLGGHPEFLAADGVHPNDAGYAAITAAVEAKL